eukprot:CAMPEP_0116873982 /NCGR_PEP_ID=MMETSP0463-20121206/5352_1 /TAXON_ID=181622 /ORGANISM="Strombidinopsis sp, Strain SopsisLIS2011" /LENGTH=37 /DNA_ID= /DNA_START= /DNA_END= /DNA_ORIENTATION=
MFKFGSWEERDDLEDDASLIDDTDDINKHIENADFEN